MKRLILLAALCLGLTGCSSSNSTKEIEEAALDSLEESYNITDAEVLSIEPTEQYGSIFVILIGYIFGGESYEVTVIVNDSVSTVMEGTVHEDLTFQRDNYVEAKHEALKEENDTYLNLLNDLENMGIVLERITKEYDYELYHQDIRLLHYALQAKTIDFDSEEVVQHLHKLSKHILENIDSTIEINLQLALDFYEMEEFTEKLVEVELTHANEKKFVEKMDQLMHHAHLTNQVNENLKKEIETFKIRLARSQLTERLNSNQDNSFHHEISLYALKEIEANDLLNGMNFLRENGFDETYVKLYFANGYTDQCQVKQVRNERDISRCYGQIYEFGK